MAQETTEVNKKYYWLNGNTHPKKRNEEINLISTFQQIVNNLN
jgi:hypothetical protein